jgi:RND family efflux transporter MFP subunit
MMWFAKLSGAAAVLALAIGLGWFLRGDAGIGPSSAGLAARKPVRPGACPDGAEPLFWKAPMDPTFIRQSPGKSPMGMDLVPECPAAHKPASAPGVVSIDPTISQQLGIRTAVAERRAMHREIRAVGVVALDEERIVHVHTKVQGWVEKLSVHFVGQIVERGEPLLEIYSPDLVATSEELLLALRYRDETRDSPFEDVSRGGEQMFEAARQRLRLWDIPDAEIQRLVETGEVRKTLRLHAPTSGAVTELGVRHGMEVTPRHNLYTIADLSALWVLADIYEFELPWVELGQAGTFELTFLPGEQFTGRVTYISPFLDPKTRTAQVRLELANEDGRLKPAMFGTVALQTRPRPDAIAVPTEAVIRSGTRSVIFVERGEGHFEPREVELGINPGDGWREVTRGIAEGESVVVSGQFLIDSESRLREAMRKFLPPDGDESRATEGDGHAHADH